MISKVAVNNLLFQQHNMKLTFSPASLLLLDKMTT